MFLLEHFYFYLRIHSRLDDVWRVESGLGVEGPGFPRNDQRIVSAARLQAVLFRSG
jgi:hypothetical protein